MRFRTWHLLALMALVAVWAPLAQWLLALEAQDHPQRPQTTLEVAAFWLGSAALVYLPSAIAWGAIGAVRARKERDSSLTNVA